MPVSRLYAVCWCIETIRQGLTRLAPVGISMEVWELRGSGGGRQIPIFSQ